MLEVYNTQAVSLNNVMTFRVMTPKNYETCNNQYPVLYAHDGQNIFQDETSVDGYSWKFEEYCKTNEKFLPKVIIVAIDSPQTNNKRTTLYTPFSKHFEVKKGSTFPSDVHGRGKEYLDWIVNDLKPWIDNRYRTIPEAKYTGICGNSTGSVISLYALLKYPFVFSRMISISGAFYYWYDLLKPCFETVVSEIEYIYLDVGTKDQGRITKPKEFVEGNTMITQELSKLGYNDSQIAYHVFPEDKHTNYYFGRRFPDALRWIFQDCN